MIVAITSDQAAASRRPNAKGNSMTEFIGRNGIEGSDPQAFLIETTPNRVIEPHFHPVDQFQLFAGGFGRLGKKAVSTGSLQYADANTPYGPIVDESGAGIAFFTLRPVSSATTHYMPGSRQHMPKRAGRNLVAAVDVSAPAAPRANPLFVEDDGVAAFDLGAPSGSELPAPLAPPNGGAYLVVLAGSVEHEAAAYGPRSCFWIGSHDTYPPLIAGLDGAVAAYMAFPRADDRPTPG
jgi:hypothetical protein